MTRVDSYRAERRTWVGENGAAGVRAGVEGGVEVCIAVAVESLGICRPADRGKRRGGVLIGRKRLASIVGIEGVDTIAAEDPAKQAMLYFKERIRIGDFGPDRMRVGLAVYTTLASRDVQRVLG